MNSPIGGEFLSRQQQRYLARQGRKPARRVSHCHIMIREVAKAACAELYDKRMVHNAVYDSWKAMHPDLCNGPYVVDSRALRERFVEKYWGSCIPFARATLAQLLTRPTIDTTSKDSIMEALELDASLRLGRANPQAILGEIK